MDDVLVNLDIFYGHIALDSRLRRDGDMLIGEGRAKHYDGQGNLTKDTGWKPTGCNLVLNGWEPPSYLYSRADTDRSIK